MRSVNQILQDGKQIYSVTQQKREKLKAKWLQAGGCSEAGMEDFRVQDWRITQLLHSPYPFCVENWLPAPNTKHTYRVAFCRDCLRKSLNSGAPGTDEGTLITLTPITFPHLTPLESWQTGLYTKGRRKKNQIAKNYNYQKLFTNRTVGSLFDSLLVGGIMDSKEIYILIPGWCQYVTLQDKRDSADVIKDHKLKIRELSYLIQMVSFDHLGP